MRKKIYYYTSLLGVVIVLLLLSACGNLKQSSSKLQQVKYIPYSGSNGMAVKYGIKKGIFKKAGIKVKLIEANKNVPNIVESGQADIAEAATTSVILAAGKGAPLKIVSSAFRTQGPFYLISKPDIKNVKDLRGKKVGIGQTGSGLDLTTRVILKDNGLTSKDVTFVADGVHQQAYSALQNNQVAATIIHEPFVSLGESTGKAKLLARGWDYLPNFHTGVLTANNKFIKTKPKLLKSFLKAYFESQTYAKKHQLSFIKFVHRSEKNISLNVLKKAYRRENILWKNNPSVNMKDLKETQNLQIQFGFQKKAYNLNKIVDQKYIPKKYVTKSGD